MRYRGRLKNGFLPASVIVVSGLLLIAAVLYIYTVYDPSESVLFPKCIFHSLTGLDCPGCGSQRAIHSLLHGHISEAWHYNALMTASLPYILLWVILKSVDAVAPHSGPAEYAGKALDILYHGKAVTAVAVIVLLFWIVRNVFPEIF